MRINGLTNIAFKRQFSQKEKKQALDLHIQAQNALGHTGHNILIVHDTCLPVNPKTDIGVGHLLSKEGLEFIKDMKTYLGINNIEVHPQGEYYVSSVNKFCCPYSGTGLSLGEHLISLEALKTKEFGKLLKDSDIKPAIDSNIASNKTEILNYENVINKLTPTPTEKVLKIAFERFKNSNNTSLKKEFELFKNANADWLEKYALYRALLKENKKRLFNWSLLDQNLFNSEYESTLRNTRISEISTKYAEEIEFYKFNQFLSEKSLKVAKQNINSIGLKLTGDCLIGFGDETVFAFPKAFMKNKSIGWGIQSLDYDKILDENSDAAKLLKRKVELFAKRYDGIRFDVSWAYLTPAITTQIDDKRTVEHRKLYTDKLLTMIEDTVKSIKGKDYDLTNLIHEFEASGQDFELNGQNRSFINDRMKVYSMQYMKRNWGYLDGYKSSVGFEPEKIVIGLGNQDGVPHSLLTQIEDVDFSNINKEEQYRILTKTLGGKPEDLAKKDEALLKRMIDKYKELVSCKKSQIEILGKKYKVDFELLKTKPKEFAKYKAAEVFSGAHSMFYFMDILGSNKVFDAHDLNSYENYRYRIPNNYLKTYIDNVIDGFGINMFDIYEKQFKAQGLDKKYPELFSKIIELKNILLEPNEIDTKSMKKKLLFSVAIGSVILASTIKLLITKKDASNDAPFT